jgi:hypothetical protein
VSIYKVFFYCDAVASAPSVTAATLNGNPVSLTWIGTMPATNPSLAFHAYRADVTALFTGVGSYTWTTTSGGTNRGAFLAGFGFNPGDPDIWEVQVRDGAHGGVTADGVEANWPNPVVFDNFLGVVAWPADAELTWVVAGGDAGLHEEYLANSVSIAGDDPATHGLDWSSIPAENLVSSSTTSITTNCSELSDAIQWMVGIFRHRSCDACPLLHCQADGSGPALCPCNNFGTSERGCASSASIGGGLVWHGTVHPDTLVLEATGLVSNTLSLLFQGSASISPIVFGDGVRCVGGSLKRLYAKLSDGGGFVQYPGPGDLSLSARSAYVGDPLALGATRWYQVYYRDPNVTYCGPALFNASSGLMIPW